jgi:hypothetical protein
MKHWQICFPERVHQAGKGLPCLGTSAPEFGRSEAASIAILWRTESRAKASTHFARAARRVLRVAVFASIAFGLMLRHRVLTATTVFIVIRHVISSISSVKLNSAR